MNSKEFLAHKFVILLPIACILINIIFLVFYIFLGWFYIPYLLWIILWDRKTPEKGGRNNIQWFRNWKLFKSFQNYFPAHTLYSNSDKPCVYANTDKPCIYGIHPHGVISIASWTTILHTTDIRIATLTGNFYVPIYRELLLWFGFVSASKKSIINCLKQNKSVGIIIGGAEESLCISKGIILDKRKGFIKIALETGTPLVPVYNFGEKNLYNVTENNKAILYIQQLLKRLLGFTIPSVFHLFPKQVPILTVFGDKIMCNKIENPTKEDIDNLHNQYKKALLDLHQKYKVLGKEEETLKIIM